MNKHIVRSIKKSKYVPVSENDYLNAIKIAMLHAEEQINKTKGVFTKKRLQSVIQHLKKELNLPYQLTEDDSLYGIDKDGINSILGFSEITFGIEYSDGTQEQLLLSVNETLKGVDKSTIERVNNAIVAGYILGKNPYRIVRKIGEIPNVEMADLHTLVYTMVADTQNKRNMKSLERHKDLYDGFKYSAASDDSTTTICRKMNGKRWKTFDDIPKELYPPIHPNCRSMITGVIGN